MAYGYDYNHPAKRQRVRGRDHQLEIPSGNGQTPSHLPAFHLSAAVNHHQSADSHYGRYAISDTAPYIGGNILCMQTTPGVHSQQFLPPILAHPATYGPVPVNFSGPYFGSSNAPWMGYQQATANPSCSIQYGATIGSSNDTTYETFTGRHSNDHDFGQTQSRSLLSTQQMMSPSTMIQPEESTDECVDETLADTSDEVCCFGMVSLPLNPVILL